MLFNMYNHWFLNLSIKYILSDEKQCSLFEKQYAVEILTCKLNFKNNPYLRTFDIV